MSPAREWLEAELSKLGTPVRIGVCLFVAGAIVGMGLWLWIQPLRDRIDQTRAQTLNAEKRLSRIDPKKYLAIADKNHKEQIRYAQRLLEARKTLKTLEREAKKHHFFWFDQARFLKFLEAILRQSQNLGLQIDRIERIPLKRAAQDENRSVQRNAEAQKAKRKTPAPPHIAVVRKVSITGSGTYPHLIRLLYFIESFTLPIEVAHTEIEYDEKNATTRYKVQLDYYGMEPGR